MSEQSPSVCKNCGSSNLRSFTTSKRGNEKEYYICEECKQVHRPK